VTPGFSERTFEFCFNAEYCQLNAALLATYPNIPSQRMEKDLGYDVEFKIKDGTYTKSVFLQHKVSSFAEKRAGSNSKFYSVHRGPYLRFAVDNDQHNLLCELSRTRGNAFYCAPRFSLRRDLETHYRATGIGANSIFLDPVDVGDINDDDRHNITYNPLGKNPTLHSEPVHFRRSFSGGKENAPELRRVIINSEYVRELSHSLLHRAQGSRFAKFLTPTIQRVGVMRQAQILLGRIYQVSWLLLP
jgi:hypothetical protein